MKKLILFLSVLCLSVIIISCASTQKATQKKEAREQKMASIAKDALRSVLNKREDSIKKYNVKCNYRPQPGQITIDKIEPLKENQLRVLYSYKPDSDAANREDYLMGSTNRSMLLSGEYPTKEWCERNGVKVGAQFPATRMEIVEGYMTKYCDQFTFHIPLLKN